MLPEHAHYDNGHDTDPDLDEEAIYQRTDPYIVLLNDQAKVNLG